MRERGKERGREDLTILLADFKFQMGGGSSAASWGVNEDGVNGRVQIGRALAGRSSVVFLPRPHRDKTGRRGEAAGRWGTAGDQM